MLELAAAARADRTPVEAECLSPDKLRNLSVAQIAEQPVFHGNRRMTLGDFFRISGDAADGELRITGDCSTVKWIGMGMTSGRIVVEGDVGMHLGSEMAGGEIAVFGNAGDWVGAEMTAGRIHVHGNAGHLIGAGYRGSKVGMRGGVILIDGSAGNEVGGAMRRGLIAIGGDCGDFAGVAMIAGSILVFGTPGIRLGAGMKRGTIGLFGLEGKALAVLPTFRYDCEYQPDFMRLYLAKLTKWGFPLARDFAGEGLFRRYNGDMIELGKGEILAWNAHGA